MRSGGDVLESRICSNPFDISAYIGSQGSRVSGIISVRYWRFCERLSIAVVVALVAVARHWENTTEGELSSRRQSKEEKKPVDRVIPGGVPENAS